MSRKRRKVSKAEQWTTLSEQVGRVMPHLVAWWDDDDDFVEIRLKLRPDGTVLAIAKGYDSDGGPVVCFGTGYGVLGALMSVDGTIQGGRWREDKPWKPAK